MTQVSCQGFVDRADDGVYGAGTNQWDNPFSNQSALFRMSDGSMCRINEFRRIGHPGAVRMALFGTRASFEENAGGAVWVTKNRDETRRLDELLACSGVPASQAGDQMEQVTAADGTHLGASSVHPIDRLPGEFIGLPNGHAGSHQFLVDDFVRACVQDRTPPNHVWDAARYTIPGIVAHESARQGGILLEVPDCGDAPPTREKLLGTGVKT